LTAIRSGLLALLPPLGDFRTRPLAISGLGAKFLD
jgi:hypothetical protein